MPIDPSLQTLPEATRVGRRSLTMIERFAPMCAATEPGSAHQRKSAPA